MAATMAPMPQLQQGVGSRALPVEPGRGLHPPFREHFDELLLALRRTIDLPRIGGLPPRTELRPHDLPLRVELHLHELAHRTEFRLHGFPKAADFRGQDTDIVLGRVFDQTTGRPLCG